VATPGETEEPEEGCLLAEGVRCRENGCLSRGGGGSGIGWKMKPAPVPGTSTGDTGVKGRNLSRAFRRQQRRTRSRYSGRSEANAVKQSASSTSQERVDSHAELGYSSLTTWDARVGRKRLWSVKARSRQVESRDQT
jgi:hypothetical protein